MNVIALRHQREGLALPLAETAVELAPQTRDEEHCADRLARLREWGYEVERVRR